MTVWTELAPPPPQPCTSCGGPTRLIIHEGVHVWRCQACRIDDMVMPSSKSAPAQVAEDPSCPVCGRRMLALITFERGPVGWVCVSEHPNPLDDFLPGRTPADEFIAEWERLGASAETAERIDAFFSGANPEPHPPVAPGSPDSDTRRAEGPGRVSGPGSRPSAGGTRGPGFLEVCVRDALARAPWPLTAFEIAREVLKGHPNRWASRSIERKVSKLAERGVLREVDCEGLSPDRSPCWRYELGAAA